ncbi:MAG: response regulator [Anaerolineales bacterium]|nr:response regulator [Anaerolineales bacterium]
MKTVWYIDDDKEMIQAVRLMLKMLKFRTISFNDARVAARSLLNGEHPTLIILDINMPKVSGIEFLTFLRKKETWKGIPVVMLSSEADDVQVDEALALGADSYVTKPVMINELENAIDQAITNRLEKLGREESA